MHAPLKNPVTKMQRRDLKGENEKHTVNPYQNKPPSPESRNIGRILDGSLAQTHAEDVRWETINCSVRRSGFVFDFAFAEDSQSLDRRHARRRRRNFVATGYLSSFFRDFWRERKAALSTGVQVVYINKSFGPSSQSLSSGRST